MGDERRLLTHLAYHSLPPGKSFRADNDSYCLTIKRTLRSRLISPFPAKWKPFLSVLSLPIFWKELSQRYLVFPFSNKRECFQCEWISYFRLQQTCHYIDELVRTSLDIKNIKIYPANRPNYALFLEKDSHDLDELRLKFYVYKGPIDVKCPYGIRFKELRPGENHYIPFKNSFRKLRQF